MPCLFAEAVDSLEDAGGWNVETIALVRDPCPVFEASYLSFFRRRYSRAVSLRGSGSHPAVVADDPHQQLRQELQPGAAFQSSLSSLD